MKMLPPALRWGIITLLGSSSILFSPPSSRNEPPCLVEGLVNVAPYSRGARCSPRRRCTLVYNSRDDSTAATADELFPARPTAVIYSSESESSSSSLRDVAAHDTQAQVSSLQTTIPPTTLQLPSQSVETAPGSSQKRRKPAQRTGVWMPPSKNIDQRRGKIFSIQKPQDLLDFVIEDERLSVVKVYASWCKTCQVFDVRYRGLAAKYGDKPDNSRDGEWAQNGRVRFAEMQYDDPNNEEMCQLLNATKLPYILMYKGSRGRVKEFHCSPAKFQLLINAVNEFADDLALTNLEVSNDSVLFPEMIEGLEISDVASSDLNPDEETIDGLEQQHERETAEKMEMFEVTKAQLESDKEYIQKLECSIKSQQSMLDAIQKSNEEKMQSLSNEMIQQQEEGQQLKTNISAYQTQVHQLIQKISELENSITSLELESSFNENLAKDREQQLRLIKHKLEEQKDFYEKERNSMRKLALLGMKRIARGTKSILFRLRGKEIS